MVLSVSYSKGKRPDTYQQNNLWQQHQLPLLNLDTKQSKSAQNSWKSLTTLFFGFLNQEFTEMWYDASSSSKQNFYDFFQNTYFKGNLALEIPDSERSLVRRNGVFIYSAFPGNRG